MCGLTIKEPVCSGLHPPVTPQAPVLVNNLGGAEESKLEVVVDSPGVLKHQPEAPLKGNATQLVDEAKEPGPVGIPLKDVVNDSPHTPCPVVPLCEAVPHGRHTGKIDAGEEGQDEVILADIVKQAGLMVPCILNGLEEVISVICLPKVVLYVIVLSRDSQFDELLLEGSTLFKEAMHFSLDFHLFHLDPFKCDIFDCKATFLF